MTLLELSPEAAAERAGEVFEILGREDSLVLETLAALNRALDIEDRNWTHILGGAHEDGGFQLAELQDISQEIRKAMVRSPIIDRGAQLRHSYVWSKGIKLPDLKPESYGARSGPKSAADRTFEAFEDSINQANVFSDTAHEEMERAEYSDGQFFLLGDNKTKILRRVPLSQITNLLTNPDFGDEVWAWRRTWTQTDRTGKKVVKNVWYYTDDCPQPLRDRAKRQIQGDPVDHTQTFIVHAVNRQVGWALGIPDAVAVVAWAKLYSEFLKHGYIMSRALASIAFKATVPSKKGGENAKIQLASATGAGQAVVSAGELTSLPTAGRGYDFNSGRPLAAMVATGVQVSIVHLLSDPGAAGSSYGSASNLDLPTKRAVVSRQKSWAAYFQRVLRWMGVENPAVTFPALDEVDLYRELQAIALGWNTGLLHPGEIRERLLDLLDIITDSEKWPEGVMLPNNEKSLARPDVDADGTTPPTTAAPDQGARKGTGNSGAHDLRDDKVGEGLSAMRTEQLLDLILEQISRLNHS
ncbi:hypothetical protein [Microbacterium sp. No. 7]|uniref:hypothetical protein n=1 Tax=Microbacterium sp. No. 7 TaxID=1714373 RepID=UPI0006ECE81A|nr:hypothetical protein [Microbacterium sp. No. 7]ALJ19500.1 hypothetical protein AOA12_06100 [Microbacterium sp. No. 7]